MKAKFVFTLVVLMGMTQASLAAVNGSGAKRGGLDSDMLRHRVVQDSNIDTCSKKPGIQLGAYTNPSKSKIREASVGGPSSNNGPTLN